MPQKKKLKASKAKAPDIEGSKRRRDRVMTTIANGRDVAQRRAAALEQKPPATLSRREKVDLARARAVNTRAVPVGAPPQLAQFHKWIAVHYFWEREQPGGKAIIAYRLVGEAWGVTKTTIVKAVKQHEAAARQMLAAIDIEENIRRGIEENIKRGAKFSIGGFRAFARARTRMDTANNIVIMADTYRKLAAAETLPVAAPTPNNGHRAESQYTLDSQGFMIVPPARARPN